MKTLHRTKTLVLAGSLLLQLSTLCLHSQGAAGDVDLSFDPGSGVNGIVNAVAVQPDGKVIIGGQFTLVRGLARTNIARLNADGSGDSSFVSAPLDNPVYSLFLQIDGKLLVGSEGFNFGLTRVNSNGSRDTNFNGNAFEAIASTESFDVTRVSTIVVQPDGKIFFTGEGLLRLNSNGTLDNSFRAEVPEYVYSMALQSDGKVIIGGYFQYPGNLSSYGLARLNANGSVDNSFDGTAGSNGLFFSVVLQPDGKVLVGGSFITVDGINSTSIARLNADGTVDTSFQRVTGTGGVTFPHPVYAVALQSGGKVIIGGEFISINGESHTNLARLNADGSLDDSFNPSTGVGAGYGYYSAVHSLVVQSDGKVLIGGDFTVVNGTNRNRMARLNGDGSLDIGFQPGRGLSNPVSLLELQSDGKVVVNRDTRLNADGSVDSTYVYIPNTNFIPNIAVPGAHYSVAQCSATQVDGKVIIGGSTATILNVDEFNNHYFSFGWFVARVNADGTRDTNFNLAVGGYYGAWAAGSSPWSARDPWTPSVRVLEVQPDGKVLVGATFGVARLNANGSPDNSFTSGIGGSVYSMLLRPDGRVLVGSSAGVAWLNSNGIRDPDFNPTINLSFFYPVALVLQPDGRVLVGGSFSTVNGVSRKNIARLNSNGSLDTSFNTGTGSDAAVRAIALQPDGNVLIAGDFLTINGVVRPYVARLYGDSVAPLPSLNIARSNSFVIVSWPSSSTGFTLQQNTNGIATVNWSNVITTPTDNGTTKTVIVNLPTANRFFRLKSQYAEAVCRKVLAEDF